MSTKFVKIINIYNCCFGQLSIGDSFDGSNLWFLNFDAYKLVFGTLDCLKLKSFEYQVCSAHQYLQSLYRTFFSFEKGWTKCSSNFTSVWHSFRKSMRFKNLWLVFDKTFSNEKMSYVTIVDLAKMIKLGIQRFFIWGHLVSHLSKFDLWIDDNNGEKQKKLLHVGIEAYNYNKTSNMYKWPQIKNLWIPSLIILARSTIVT